MTIRVILLDLEGVLYQQGEPIEGARETVRRLRAMGYPLRFLTNTTTRPRAEIAGRLRAMGFEAPLEDVFSPTFAAALELETGGERRVHLAAEPALAADFGTFELVETAPDAVVMGDLGADFTWERLNGLFRMVSGGARLIALHKNRYWRKEQNLVLDLGPFVAALEYGADIEALVVGKPARAFYQLSLRSLGAALEETLMIGDDIEGDVGGAQNAGLVAVQVRTGKYRGEDEHHPRIRPDYRIDSILELVPLLERIDLQRAAMH